MYHKFELWETSNGPILVQPSSLNARDARKSLLAETSRVCLMVFTARSVDEAQERVADFLEQNK